MNDNETGGVGVQLESLVQLEPFTHESDLDLMYI